MSGIRVLVVDDSLLFREILSQELQKYLPAGSALETANDPFEARDKILSFAPDVMLLDVELPNLIITPHAAWLSEQALAKLAQQLVDNIAAFLQGEPRNLVVTGTYSF